MSALLFVAAIALPPKPSQYVTDRAGVIRNASALNEKLANFERSTSDQILVYTDQHLPPDTTIDEMGAEAMRTWGVGQKGKDNGVILFVFIADRKMRIEAGYGLEASLTDAKAKWITSTIIKPEFQRGDFDRGIINGVDAILATVKGEGYHEANVHVIPIWVGWLVLLLLIGFVIYAGVASIVARIKGRTWGGIDPLQWVESSGSGSGGGSSSDSGGFSGGGGSGGGGGASDSW